MNRSKGPHDRLLQVVWSPEDFDALVADIAKHDGELGYLTDRAGRAESRDGLAPVHDINTGEVIA